MSPAPESTTAQITSSGPGMEIQQSGTTMMIDDAVTSSFTMMNLTSNVLNVNSDVVTEQTLKEFLAKPRIVQRGVFQTTDTVSTWSPFRVLGDIVNQNPYQDKLEGYMGIRASVVFTLQVNATRFQQGRYMLCAVPQGGAGQSVAQKLAFHRFHATTLNQRVQLPHVELDIACETSATMKLPYVSIRNADLIQRGGINGPDTYTVCLYPYSPLVAASGDNTASYTLWSHLEDVELYAFARPQSGFSTSVLKKNATDQERDRAMIQPLSSGLKTVSSGLAVLSNNPLLSTIARPLAWVTDVASKAAWSLGYSKPNDLSPVRKIKRTVMPYYNNVDAPDESAVLSLTSRNQVNPLPGFAGSDVDEMAFSSIVTRYGFWRSFTFADTDVAGTELTSFDVRPGNAFNGPDSYGAISMTPVCFISSMFMYYRGSMRMKFKFVKTEFHSGRLGFVFSPSSMFSTGATTEANFDYLPRTIVDLRYQNEVVIDVPFVSLSAYRECFNSTANQSLYLYVYVVDPLIAPNTVSSSITVLTEVCGGDDMQFVGFKRPDKHPVLEPVYQSGLDACAMSSGGIGNTSPADNNVAYSASAAGEHITSLRQIIKMNTLSPFSDAPTFFSHFRVRPFAIQIGTWDVSSFSFVSTYSDLYDLVSACYALSRGSVRVKLFYRVAASNTSTGYRSALTYLCPSASAAQSKFVSSPTDQEGNTDGINATQNCTIPTVYDIEGGFEYQVPQYLNYHSRAVSDNIVCVDTTLKSAVDVTNSAFKYTANTYIGAGYDGGFYFSRSAGEDCELGMFVSVPLTIGKSGLL
nr:MAG: structural polyprotein [Hangzhou dicistro-like virus 5]